MAGIQQLLVWDGLNWELFPRDLVLTKLATGKLTYIDCHEAEGSELLSYLKKLGIILNMYVLPLKMPIANVDATSFVSQDRPWRTDVKPVYAFIRIK